MAPAPAEKDQSHERGPAESGRRYAARFPGRQRRQPAGTPAHPVWGASGRPARYDSGMIPWNNLKSNLEQDPEFRYTIRHWTASLRLSVGDAHHAIRFEDGAVAALEPCEADTPSDVFLAGPEEEWRELLREVPRPFYQDPFFASVHHGIEMNHDQLEYAAYYPALRRLVQVMREVSNETERASA